MPMNKIMLNYTILKKKYLWFLLFFAAILWGNGYVQYPFNTNAPDVTFSTITGQKIVLKELRGKPVIITFWATDCPSCIDEIPHLTEIYQRYHQQGLEIIAVAMIYDPPSHVVSMAKAKGLPYDVALDLSAALARAFGNVNLTPTTFLISPQGKISEHIVGAIDPAHIKTQIEELLKG